MEQSGADPLVFALWVVAAAALSAMSSFALAWGIVK